MSDGVGTAYGRAAYDQQGVLATWMPDRVLRVGDVVSRSKQTGALTVRTTLKELIGDKHLPLRLVTNKGPERLVFQRGAAIESSAAANSAPGRAELRLSGASSFVFAAEQGTSVGYERTQPVRAAIRELGSRGVWEKDWQLVTNVRTFSRCLVLIARGSGVTASIGLAPTAIAATPVIDNIDAAFATTITRGDAVKWELARCTPLYEGLVLRHSMFRPDTVDDRFLDEPSDADAPVVRARPDMLDIA
jgi:hypothetical protein